MVFKFAQLYQGILAYFELRKLSNLEKKNYFFIFLYKLFVKIEKGMIIMNITKKVALLSLTILSLSILQPVSALADTSNSVQQTTNAIDKATNSDDVNVEDAKLNQSVQTSNGELLVTLPEHANDEIQLEDGSDNIAVSLPDQFSSNAVKAGNTAIYEGDGSDLGLQNTDLGFRALISITDPNASNEYSFDINLPEGYQLFDAAQLDGKAPGTGDIYIVDKDGIPVNMIAAAWAKDSNGNAVSTHYVINGNTVTQVIDFDKDNFFPIVADPNWIKLGKHWYNQRGNVATAIDVAAVIAGVGFAAKTSSTVIKLIRANRTKITRVVEAKIASMLGKSVASWVGTAISIGLTIGGTSIGDLVARGLDYADGNYDGYVFP